jgi:hypothetical protein
MNGMLKNRFQVSRARRLWALGALAVVAACGSTKTDSSAIGTGGVGAESGWTFLPPGSNSGGSAPSAGSASGGTPGHAGSAGTAGSGGAVTMPPVTFKCGGKQPNQPLITSFDGFKQDRWLSPGNLDGGVYVYPSTLKPAAGDFLRFQDQVATYTGIGVWFSGCIDASKFSGVRFTISGDAGMSGKVNFYLITNRDKYVDEPNGVGACVPADPVDFWPTCHPPGLTLPVTAAPTVMSVPWSAFKDGLPATTTDGSDVLALEWAFNWQAGDIPYAASLTVDNIEFYVGDGVGGAGGAGGAPPDPVDDGGASGAPAAPGAGGAPP